MPLGIGGPMGTSSLFAMNMLRLNNLGMQRNLAQLSSGNRLISGAIDPSGLAISQGFRARIGGTDQAIYNAQDTVNLARTADSTLARQTEVLGRMRDLSVRSANEATLTTADQARLDQEYQSLSSELTRLGETSNFNTKQLTSEANQYGTQAAQVGPDADVNNQMDVTIDPSTANTMGLTGSDITTGANARDAITRIDTALGQVSSGRANLGITENRLQYTVNDLSTQRINLSAANSRIADINMAAAITEQTKLSLLGQTTLAALSQNNAQAMGVLKLLGA